MNKANNLVDFHCAPVFGSTTDTTFHNRKIGLFWRCKVPGRRPARHRQHRKSRCTVALLATFLPAEASLGRFSFTRYGRSGPRNWRRRDRIARCLSPSQVTVKANAVEIFRTRREDGRSVLQSLRQYPFHSFERRHMSDPVRRLIAFKRIADFAITMVQSSGEFTVAWFVTGSQRNASDQGAGHFCGPRSAHRSTSSAASQSPSRWRW